MNLHPISSNILKLANASEQSDWPQPSSLDVPLSAVKKLDLACLPEPLRLWLEDSSRRMQCPIDFLAVSSVVVYSAIVGARCAIAPKHYDKAWKVVPNLWGGIIGGPGAMKTPALNASLTVLHRLETKCGEDLRGSIGAF